jgi:hypothetical protein
MTPEVIAVQHRHRYPGTRRAPTVAKTTPEQPKQANDSTFHNDIKGRGAAH